MKNKFVLLDLETSGLNPEENKILEIGIKVVDSYFNILSEYNGIVSVKEELEMDDFVLNMHTNNGLLEECKKSTKSLNEIEQECIDFLNRLNCLKYPMTGNSIHFDRSFIKNQMPKLHELFSYRNIDISSFKEVCEVVAPSLIKESAEIAHRASDDIDMSISYLKHYVSLLSSKTEDL